MPKNTAQSTAMQPKPRANVRGILYFVLRIFSGLYNEGDSILPEGTFCKPGKGTDSAYISLARPRGTRCMQRRVTPDSPGWNLAFWKFRYPMTTYNIARISGPGSSEGGTMNTQTERP